MGTILKTIVLAFALALWTTFSWAAGPVETSIFAVQGVEVDVTDVDAQSAKNKALVEVQVKAFKQLAEKLGNASLVEAVAKFDEKKILPFLKSLSIEQESISPGRYQGKLTVRFLPDRIKALYADFGVRVGGEQGPSFLVLPVWKNTNGDVLWEENPWRQAWINLRAEQALVPIIVPLSGFEDSELISVTDVLSEDQVKLEALRKRYDVTKVIAVFAEPVEGGKVHARVAGDSPLGKLNFDKVYDAETGRVEDSAALAVQKIHAVMMEKFKSGKTKVAEQKKQLDANAKKTISVQISFSGPSQWNGLRSRILSTPGVTGLDVSTLGADGAVVALTFVGTTDDMATSMQASGLKLSRADGNWAISQF